MPSTLVVDNIQPRTGTTVTMPAGSKLYAPGGIVQVYQTELTTLFSSTVTQTWTDITGLSVNITPTSITSKILIFVDIKGSINADNATTRLVRNSTPIHVGTDATGSMTASSGADLYNPTTTGMSHCHIFLDSPSTTLLTTYKMQFWLRSNTIYFNAGYSNTNANYNFRGASSITVMEVAQ